MSATFTATPQRFKDTLAKKGSTLYLRVEADIRKELDKPQAKVLLTVRNTRTEMSRLRRSMAVDADGRRFSGVEAYRKYLDSKYVLGSTLNAAEKASRIAAAVAEFERDTAKYMRLFGKLKQANADAESLDSVLSGVAAATANLKAKKVRAVALDSYRGLVNDIIDYTGSHIGSTVRVTHGGRVKYEGRDTLYVQRPFVSAQIPTRTGHPLIVEWRALSRSYYYRRPVSRYFYLKRTSGESSRQAMHSQFLRVLETTSRVRSFEQAAVASRVITSTRKVSVSVQIALQFNSFGRDYDYLRWSYIKAQETGIPYPASDSLGIIRAERLRPLYNKLASAHGNALRKALSLYL